MDDLWHRSWLFLASIAGGITALSFKPWKEMRTIEIVLSVFVSTSFGIFVAPWIITSAWDHPTIQTASGVTWVMASGSNLLIPIVIRWFSRAFAEGKS